MASDHIAWIGRTADQWKQSAEQALDFKRQRTESVYAIPADRRNFQNTIAALQYAEESLSDVQQQLDLMVSVHPDESVREAAQHITDHIDEENVKMDYDHRLWTAVSEWAHHREPLKPAEEKLADDTMRDLKRMGFSLEPEQFARLKSNVTQLRKLQTEFEKAINDWEDSIVVTREQLAGLPERYIEGLTRVGDGYRVSLEYPEYFPFMRQADDAPAREALATKEYQKGGRENAERLARMIAIRHENAGILGYPTHAAYVAEPRMVKTAQTVQTFLERIIHQLIPLARRELTELIDIKKRVLGLAERKPVQFYEVGYWSYKLLRERYDIDGEVVKEYFPLQHVIGGMLKLYEDILGLQFRHVTDETLWHPDAQLYEVHDGNKLIGRFIFDLYPRKGKYGHAAAFPVVLGRTAEDGQQVRGLLALVCNFPKTTASNPSLLTHDEVETLLHEFGHIMHALLSGGTWQRQNGFGAVFDFVEMPSQLFEEWAWDASVLSRLSAHYKTGEPMPADLQEKLIGARHHMDANFYLQQAIRALFDFRIHHGWPAEKLNADALAQEYRDMKFEFEAMMIPDSSLFPAGWSHMADYDAGYYSYLWSKVYALDLFTQFAADPLDRAVGARYRRCILEPGSSRSEMDLIRDFLGREPTDAPFLAALGISEKMDGKV